jgi:hypothetical protein
MTETRTDHELSARHVLSSPEDAAYELRAAAAAVFTGGRLLVGIATFVYASLAFAYFYLRSANDEDLWRPHGITAPTAVGAAIFAVAAASGALNAYGVRRIRSGFSTDWLVAGWLAVLGGVLAAGLQIYQLTRLPFYPGSSGYASCFIGWAAIDIASLVAATYWLETVLAKGIRLRVGLAAHGVAGDPAALSLFRANLEACSYFWTYLAVVGGLFWLLFYVV